MLEAFFSHFICCCQREDEVALSARLSAREERHCQPPHPLTPHGKIASGNRHIHLLPLTPVETGIPSVKVDADSGDAHESVSSPTMSSAATEDSCKTSLSNKSPESELSSPALAEAMYNRVLLNCTDEASVVLEKIQPAAKPAEALVDPQAFNYQARADASKPLVLKDAAACSTLPHESSRKLPQPFSGVSSPCRGVSTRQVQHGSKATHPASCADANEELRPTPVRTPANISTRRKVPPVQGGGDKSPTTAVLSELDRICSKYPALSAPVTIRRRRITMQDGHVANITPAEGALDVSSFVTSGKRRSKRLARQPGVESGVDQPSLADIAPVDWVETTISSKGIMQNALKENTASRPGVKVVVDELSAADIKPVESPSPSRLCVPLSERAR